ncbi:MAG: uroporphyrinogen decarboxylase family protein [Candidatus Helarchaeota archaeon]
MKIKNHRIGCGHEPRSPTGLMEHAEQGELMERAFESRLFNKVFNFLIRFSTSDRVLTVLRGASGGKVLRLQREIVDILSTRIDKRLFDDVAGAKDAFVGKITGSKYRSVLGGFVWELASKYVRDWTKRQQSKTRIDPPKRHLRPVKKTYLGWKKLRDELQPGWEVFPKDAKNGIVKVLPDDVMSPSERVQRLIQGKSTDRVGFGPQWDWGIAFMGGSNLWKFCYDGIETGWASLNVWLRIGGCDYLPFSSGLAAYSHPFPEAHSRFFYNWGYPSDDAVPQFIEKTILKTYDDLFNHGMSGLAREITKRMIRDFLILVREISYSGKVRKQYFGPYERQFFPYSELIFYTWDILPMWRGVVPFMMDMRRQPEAVLEAFEFLNKPLTDMMIKLGKLSKARTALFGNSRGSNSFISPKQFEEFYWPSMKYSFEQCFKNGIIPMCHFDNDWTLNMPFFAEKLPKRSCIFHLDQVDLVKVHELIGDHFCLMGGMSPGLLVRGSPTKVEEETRRYIENIGEDGLVIASGCEIPMDIPVQNIYAQKRAIQKYGTFRR